MNGGNTWEPLPIITGEELRSVSALSETHAWMVGNSGTVLRSVDGASLQYVGNSSFGIILGATSRLVDPNTAWIVGADDHVRMTTDSGVSWNTQLVVHVPLLSVSAAGSSIWTVGGGGAVYRAPTPTMAPPAP